MKLVTMEFHLQYLEGEYSCLYSECDVLVVECTVYSELSDLFSTPNTICYSCKRTDCPAGINVASRTVFPVLILFRMQTVLFMPL